MKYQILFFSSILAAILLTNSCGGGKYKFVCGISDISQIGINHLQPLTDAMEKYKNDNGRYPKSFRDLIPKYLEKIPIISSGGEENVDESIFDVLKHDKIKRDIGSLDSNGSYFKLAFIPTDDRICLMGRNNICEYSSERPFWDCHQ